MKPFHPPPIPDEPEDSAAKPPTLSELRKLHSAYLRQQRAQALVLSREDLADRLVRGGVLREMPSWPSRPRPPRKAAPDSPAALDWSGEGADHGGAVPAAKRCPITKQVTVPQSETDVPAHRETPEGPTPPPPGRPKFSKKEAYEAFLKSWAAGS